MKISLILCFFISFHVSLNSQSVNTYTLTDLGIPGNEIVDLEIVGSEKFIVATDKALAIYSSGQTEIVENITTTYLHVNTSTNERTVKTRMLSTIPVVKKIYAYGSKSHIFLLENGQLLAYYQGNYFTTPEYDDGTLVYTVDFLWDRDRPFLVGSLNDGSRFFGELEESPDEAEELNAFESFAFTSLVIPDKMNDIKSLFHDTYRRGLFLFDENPKGFLYYEYDYDVGDDDPVYYELNNTSVDIDQIKWMSAHGRSRFPSGSVPPNVRGYLFVADDAGQLWRYFIYNGNRPFNFFDFETEGSYASGRFGEWENFSTNFPIEDLPDLFPIIMDDVGVIAWTAAKGTNHLYKIQNEDLSLCQVNLSATLLDGQPITGIFESYLPLSQQSDQLWVTSGENIVQFLNTKDLNCGPISSIDDMDKQPSWKAWFDGVDIQLNLDEVNNVSRIDLYHINGKHIQHVAYQLSNIENFRPKTREHGLYYLVLTYKNGQSEGQKIVLW